MKQVLDLFSCAGGSAMGLYRGFLGRYPDLLIVGVDIKPQPHYPAFHDAEYARHFRFVRGDALHPPFDLSQFDFIWASPPCQGYSKCQKIRGKEHPNLIVPLRVMLLASGVPFVIENVKGAPLINPVMLFGTMFNLGTMRPRLFESPFFKSDLFQLVPPSPRHAKMGRLAKLGEFCHVAGKGGVTGVKQQWETAMGIDWMTVAELAQAIPPAYSEWIVRQIQL